MWHTLNRLLALLTIILLAPLSAQAALTFGVAPADNSVIQSVTQAQRFSTYIEKRLGEVVDVRIFANSNNLKEALNIYQDVDLALIREEISLPADTRFEPLATSDSAAAVSDLFVIRPGLDHNRVLRMQEILSGMEQDPEGRTLLKSLGVQRFSLSSRSGPKVAPPCPAPAARDLRQLTPVRGLPIRQTTATVNTEIPELTLGLVANPGTPLLSREAAETFADNLSQRLQQRVKVKVFEDESNLNDWLRRYRMLDLALVSEPHLQSQPAGSFVLLAQPSDLPAQEGISGLSLVARPGLDTQLLAALNQSFEQIKGTPRTSGSIEAAPTPLTQQKEIRYPRTTSKAPPSARVSGDKLTLGVISAPGTFFHSADQAHRFAQQLSQRLGVKVIIQSFQNQDTLQEWITRYRMIDIGAFTDGYLPTIPSGAVIPFLSAKELGITADAQLVFRQGINASFRRQIREALLQINIEPSRTPQPVPDTATTIPAAAKKETAKPWLPVEQTIVPPAPPVPMATRMTPPTPTIAAPTVKKPALQTAAPALPVPMVTGMTPPTPTIAGPSVKKPALQTAAPAPPRAKQPTRKQEPPPVAFQPSADREKVYLMPFATVMVPETVAERIFDKFVDAVSNNGRDEKYEFIILKAGLNSVSPEWLQSHTYVTGDIFGYVEESGCCSTDIRTKSRVALYRQGDPTPMLEYEYPVKTFFDHDYSTIKRERRKIAGHISAELAKKIRSTLHGS